MDSVEFTDIISANRVCVGFVGNMLLVLLTKLDQDKGICKSLQKVLFKNEEGIAYAYNIKTF